MTKHAACALVVLLASTVLPVSARAQDSRLRAEFDRAMTDYDEALTIRETDSDRARALFRASAQRLSSVVASGVTNGRLEYNLGNCFLQAGDLGPAILHYRRAQRLAPRDPLLLDNLREARSRCVTNIEPTRRSTVLRSVFSWHFATTQATRLLTALIFYAVFWVVLTLRVLFRRRWLTSTASICLVLTLLLGGSVGMDAWGNRNAPAGVIAAMDVIVSKGPGPGYKRQFEQPLQPGVEFTLRERRGDWWRIELPDGKSGWIEASTADLVVGNTL